MACGLCTYYVDDLYHAIHHENYAATEDVVKFSCYNQFEETRNQFSINLHHYDSMLVHVVHSPNIHNYGLKLLAKKF